MINVGWDYGTSTCHLLAHIFGGDVAMDTKCLAVHVFANGHIFHLWRDDACLGTSQLGNALPFFSAIGYPLGTHVWQTFLQIDLIVRV